MKIYIQCALVLVIFIQSSLFAKPSVFCTCVNDQQIKCDETLTTAGPYRCFGDCDCSKGRYCLKINDSRPTGVCMDDKEYEIRLFLPMEKTK